MHKTRAMFAAFIASTAMLVAPAAFGAAEPPMAGYTDANSTKIDFGMMTWPEVKAALAAGKTTALFYTGGVEERGPQGVNGAHNLEAIATGRAIAAKLGNAIAMPVLNYSPNEASAELPGTIGLTNELNEMILERLSEQAIKTGFKTVIIMSDHGGGQPKSYADVAKKLDAKYASKGIHVYYADEGYRKAFDDYDIYIGKKLGAQAQQHAGIPDTSEMLYLGSDSWIRKSEIPNALGDPVPPAGQKRDCCLKINNGIMGDARKSTAALGKVFFDMKVDYFVKQIRQFQAQAKKG